MKLFKLILFLLLPFVSFAGVEHLLPKPQLLTENGMRFKLDKVSLTTPVLVEGWKKFIIENGGSLSSNGNNIEVVLVDDIPTAELNKHEAYTLKVTSKYIKIEAITEKGVFYAMQTLRQLKTQTGNKTYFEGCEITDYPAFRIRGFMHDTGRGYISINEIKKEIALLSQFKINTFHWHLTDNQAWRLESKIFPMLNDSVNMTRLPGKYYTLEEAKGLVEFCKEYNVLLIPEIEMPGHSEAFKRTFRCDMQSKEGMSILKLLIDEVCETFEVPYLHIGTDEVKFTNTDFVPEMVAYVRGKGKKAISWNPGWNYQPGEIDMTHLWSYRGKAQAGIPAIDSKLHYINHFDIFADIVALYFSRICNQPYGSDNYAGSIIAVWNDRLLESEQNIILENNFYPVMLALAERTWQGGGTEYFDKRGTILPDENSRDFAEFVNFENRMLWYKNTTLKDLPFPYFKQTDVKWRITDAFPNNGDLNAVFPPEEALSDSCNFKGTVYNTKEAIGSGIYLRHVWGEFVPSFYSKPQENHTTYAYTWVYSPEQQEVGLNIEFQNYGRSEADLPPPQGKWDYKGSRIWLNDTEIKPPVWTASHTKRSNEIALGNENWTARKPVKVTINRGWNKILLKLPVGKFTLPEVRLQKWQFTVLITDVEGKNPVNGLVYSPGKSLK